MSMAINKSKAGSARITHPAALWGIFGFVLILSQAIYRLAPLAWQPIAEGQLEAWHWALYGISIVFMGYSEGYKAFQLQVAPRVVARADYLANHPRLLHVILAPLFCMAMFHASRRRLLVSWLVYLGIIILILGVRQLDQPWRGIVDAGVVVGLSWGIIAIVASFRSRMGGAPLQSSPDLPEDARSAS
jgi:hypothetical protein